MPVKLIKFTPHQKNGLLGYAQVKIEGFKMEVNDIAIFEKNGNMSIAMPSKALDKPDGGKKWRPIMRFTDKQYAEAFQRDVLSEFKKWQTQQNPVATTGTPAADDIPY